MDNYFKFVVNNELYNAARVPFLITCFIIILIIVLAVYFVLKEVK